MTSKLGLEGKYAGFFSRFRILCSDLSEKGRFLTHFWPFLTYFCGGNTLKKGRKPSKTAILDVFFRKSLRAGSRVASNLDYPLRGLHFSFYIISEIAIPIGKENRKVHIQKLGPKRHFSGGSPFFFGILIKI